MWGILDNTEAMENRLAALIIAWSLVRIQPGPLLAGSAKNHSLRDYG
jgi:hypothetical protein